MPSRQIVEKKRTHDCSPAQNKQEERRKITTKNIETLCIKKYKEKKSTKLKISRLSRFAKKLQMFEYNALACWHQYNLQKNILYIVCFLFGPATPSHSHMRDICSNELSSNEEPMISISQTSEK